LGKKDYTIYEITNILIKAHYIEAIIDLVIFRLSELNLLNDERYATRYYDSYASYKGIKWIKQKLSQRGISFVPNKEETYTEQQVIALSKAIKSWLRKHYKYTKETIETHDHTEVLEYNEFKKLNQYLYQKGFEYSLINTYTTNEQLLEFLTFLR
jgi:SOS response regulatory protein OraA/RecX